MKPLIPFLIMALYINCGALISSSIDTRMEYFVLLDQELLNIWANSEGQSDYDLLVTQKKIEDLWCNNYKYSDNDLVMNEMDTEINALLRLNFQSKESRNVAVGNAYNILIWNKKMREKEFIKNYPLDALLEVHATHRELTCIINDPMFGLKEWGEFMLLVAELEQTFGAYLCAEEEVIQFYFPLIDLQTNKDLSKELIECIDVFVASLDSAYTPDFELPCDMISDKLNELFTIYSSQYQEASILENATKSLF